METISLNQLNQTANYRLGKILSLQEKSYDLALQCFDRILKVNDQFYKSYYHIGLIYYK